MFTLAKFSAKLLTIMPAIWRHICLPWPIEMILIVSHRPRWSRQVQWWLSRVAVAGIIVCIIALTFANGNTALAVKYELLIHTFSVDLLTTTLCKNVFKAQGCFYYHLSWLRDFSANDNSTNHRKDLLLSCLRDELSSARLFESLKLTLKNFFCVSFLWFYVTIKGNLLSSK